MRARCNSLCLSHAPIPRYLEKIDVGEAEPRQVWFLQAAAACPLQHVLSQVLSGLAGKIPLESMTGRRVVAICNLKPAKMRGLFSYAMIFAASSESASGNMCAHPPLTRVQARMTKPWSLSPRQRVPRSEKESRLKALRSPRWRHS